MYTIGKLGTKYGLSRSALLYYDQIGLLLPSARSDSNYRFYSENDAKRLEQIMLYRRVGLALKDIKSILDSPEDRLTEALEKRLCELNEDILKLRDQQRFILGILKSDSCKKIKVMNKDTWISLLGASGFSREDMLEWHAEFERLSPEKHMEFLEFLCIPKEEIHAILKNARAKK